MPCDIDGELARLFHFLDVAPMTVAELRPYFDQEWHFMGNASLFRFTGVINRSSHADKLSAQRVVRLIAGN